MSPEPGALRWLRRAVVVLATVLALFAGDRLRFRVAGIRVGPFEWMALAVSPLALLLVYECVRGWRGRR